MSHGTIAWNELNTWDPAGARAFYERTLGWTFSTMPGSDYLLAMADGKTVAGIFDMAMANLPRTIPAHWFTYIEVDGVDARLKLVEAAGGSIMRPPFDIPEVGRIAIVRDPTGGAVGLMTSVKR